METNLQDRCLSNTHFCTFKTYPYQKNILEDSQTLIVLYLYSLSILARQRIKAIFTLLISPSVYRHLFLAQSSLCILLICYGWSPQPTPALWDFQYTPIRVAFYGITIQQFLRNEEGYIGMANYPSSLIFYTCFTCFLACIATSTGASPQDKTVLDNIGLRAVYRRSAWRGIENGVVQCSFVQTTHSL